ncbi:hypothetical protein RM53_15415 [Brevundimonas nasdae]|uniref:Lipoprotein n=2 Tax=Brevundimonas nasdae TaxID=172043 RepID=A0A0B4CSN8_9CAUL|nr:hypothetical protein RM53_15415 [Brevundimonas nasdae]
MGVPMPTIRLATAVCALALLSSCSFEQAAMPTAITEAALTAARAGDLAQAKVHLARLSETRLRSCTSGRLSRHRARAIEKIEAIAVFYGSEKTATDTVTVLGAGLDRPSIDRPEECQRAEIDADMEAAIAAADAEGFRVHSAACSAILQDGLDTDTIEAVAGREEFACRGSNGALSQATVFAYAAKQLEGSGIMHLVNPLWCVKGASARTAYMQQYRADVEALGPPQYLSMTESGVTAKWLDYELLLAFEPLILRRTKGHFPSQYDIEAVTHTDGNHFSDYAVNAADGLCLSEKELSRILIDFANRW